MSYRMTKKMVDHQFDRVMQELCDTGANVDNWILVHGSVTYGRAWYIAKRDPRNGGHYCCIGLGNNLREAYNSLKTVATIFEEFGMAYVPPF